MATAAVETLDKILAELEEVKRQVQGLRLEIMRNLSVIETVLGLNNGGYRLDRRVSDLSTRIHEVEAAMEEFRRLGVDGRLKGCEEAVSRLRGELYGIWRLLPLGLALLSLIVSIWRAVVS